jgi:hypothetical protein
MRVDAMGCCNCCDFVAMAEQYGKHFSAEDVHYDEMIVCTIDVVLMGAAGNAAAVPARTSPQSVECI